MPRRPRPVSRGGQPKINKAPPVNNTQATSFHSNSNLKGKNAPPAQRNLKRRAQSESGEEDEDDQFFGSSGDEDDEDSGNEDRGEGSSRHVFGGQGMDDGEEDDDENDDDADAPRVALWEPDDDDAYLKDDEDEVDDEVEDDIQEQPKEKTVTAEVCFLIFSTSVNVLTSVTTKSEIPQGL